MPGMYINEEMVKALSLKQKIINGREYIYSDHDATGAPIKKGDRIEKHKYENGDINPPGVQGTVIGSIGPIPFKGNPESYSYWIYWDTDPEIPVNIHDSRIRKISID